MEKQQITLQRRSDDPALPSNADAGASEALAACRRLADVADAAIDQAYSGDAKAFLAANRQDGGQ
jgi:hypothetical protein